MNVVDELHAVAAALTAAGVPYAVCGGLAVTMHGVVRTTEDIDILVPPADIPRVLAAVHPIGYIFVAGPMTFGAGTNRERHVQRVSKIVGAEHVILDLLAADASLTGMLDDRIVLDLPQGKLAIVSRATLIRMKRQAGRSIDLADIEKLEEIE
jgi:hypothetical protein